MKRGIFEIFGKGHLGLKADDLNDYSELIANAELLIPEGMVIATDIFDLLDHQIDIKKAAMDTDHNCPDFLQSINNEILEKMEVGKPYAIRSSALSERGGTGIYKSTFFIPKGNRVDDLHRLWRCELVVYESEFTLDAVLWREKNDLPIGMAILIQPVIGVQVEEYFMPVLSGTAYTSLNGLLTIRTVVGLCNLSFNGGGFFDIVQYENLLNLQRNLWNQKNADAITDNGCICQVPTQYEEIHREIANEFKTFNNFFDVLVQIKKQGSFYLEWAVFQNQIFIVQCSTYKDQLPGDLTINTDDYFLLVKGKDVLHSGQVTCDCVIYVSDWDGNTPSLLEYLNQNTRDYLLIIPQDALSELANINNQNRLAYRHFSNAKAVVEMQRSYSVEQQLRLLQANIFLSDHSSGMGATHFAQVCQRSEILFVGGEFSTASLFSLPGGEDYRRNSGITIWKSSSKVIVDAVKKEGFVYISKHSKVNKFSINQIEDWTYALRSVACNIESNREMSDHFFNVHYAIVPNSNPAEFDPFKLNESEIESLGGVNQIIKSLEVVLANGKKLMNPYEWNSGLKDYLEQLLSCLVKA